MQCCDVRCESKEKLMHQTRVSRQTLKSRQSKYLLDVLEEIDRLRKQKFRVYRTYVPAVGDKPDYVFVTTSKDIQLEISTMCSDAQYSLAKFIEEEVDYPNGRLQFLLVFDDADRPDESIPGRALLITRSVIEGQVNFTLAPAH